MLFVVQGEGVDRYCKSWVGCRLGGEEEDYGFVNMGGGVLL